MSILLRFVACSLLCHDLILVVIFIALLLLFLLLLLRASVLLLPSSLTLPPCFLLPLLVLLLRLKLLRDTLCTDPKFPQALLRTYFHVIITLEMVVATAQETLVQVGSVATTGMTLDGRRSGTRIGLGGDGGGGR